VTLIRPLWALGSMPEPPCCPGGFCWSWPSSFPPLPWVRSLVLVGVDLAIGRPVRGHVFMAGLNGEMATVFWMWRSRGR
jgi:hypothetical protein